MKDLALGKMARLTSKKAIDNIFLHCRRGGDARGFLAYPVRACTAIAFPRRDGYTGVKVLFSVPRKKIRRAVDRVTVRRRMREAWRLSKGKDCANLTDVALIYVADQVLEYHRISAAINRIVARLSDQPTD